MRHNTARIPMPTSCVTNLRPGRNASSKLTDDVIEARPQYFHAAFNLGDPAAAALRPTDDAPGADRLADRRGRRIVAEKVPDHGLRQTDG